MGISIKFAVENSAIESDLKAFKEDDIDISLAHLHMSMHEFVNYFCMSNISIDNNGMGSIAFKGPLTAFCYNFYFGLIGLMNRDKDVAYCFGVEYDEYFIKYYIDCNDIILECNNNIYKFDLSEFVDEFRSFYTKSLDFVLLHYAGIDQGIYFAKLESLLENE